MAVSESLSREILSNVIVNTKYARYREDKKRRETWNEIVNRNKQMHMERFPELKDEIQEAFQFVHDRKVMPSMRSAQFAGEAIEASENRIYNCGYLPVDSVEAFSEIMFLLLGGTGIGYSVQERHVNQLPEIQGPKADEYGDIVKMRYRIHDQIEGWADAVDELIRSFTEQKPLPRFDYSDIRPEGEPLETSGGTAPGPEPLRICLDKIREILFSKERGEKLDPVEAHDIICHIADAVLAGGIRRAALISLFDRDDREMATCKTGNWFKENPQRARANNSAVIPRDANDAKESFFSVWDIASNEGFGEPGFYFTNNRDVGTNPCAEIGLYPHQFCNLTDINAHNIESQEDFNQRAKAASFIGTLQATYTDFHYLRHKWKKRTEEQSLVGVGITGIGSGRLRELDLTEAAKIVKQKNEEIAHRAGINPAWRTTTVKPSGTSSLVCQTSSGIHAWHSEYYIRRMRVGKNEEIYNFLKKKIPGIIKDDIEAPEERAVLSFPIKAPEGSITRNSETVFELLKRIKRFNKNWVRPGHREGDNPNNVSATVTIKDHQWEDVGEWLWENRDSYNAISVLPFDGGSYEQAPFEECSREEFEERIEKLSEVDFTEMGEEEDNTDLTGEVACGGGQCEVEYL